MATVDARIASPSTMMKNREYRSAMWCGCHGVTPDRSAQAGTTISQKANAMKAGTPRSFGTRR